mmetsp:Transcript_16603/g.31456  ORF Transcript_16603/g.31456 Transcript_16603/m.31456 type:complete len:80 (+) Transcript_16603:85-324(+)
MTSPYSIKSEEVYFGRDRKSLFLVLRGCPCAQPAPRLVNLPARKSAFMYNPALKKKTLVQATVKNALGLKEGEFFCTGK